MGAKNALAKREGLEMYIETQFCFEAPIVLEWEKSVRAAGNELPIRIGIPGPATIKTLFRFAQISGIGPSMRFISKQARNVAKLMTVQSPHLLLSDLAKGMADDSDCLIEHFHFYPFGGFAKPQFTQMQSHPVAFSFCQRAALTLSVPRPKRHSGEYLMTKTLISSDKQEITIGFDAPFCVIGERINPTGRKLLAAEMAAGDYSRVLSDAVAQVEAGAIMLDVNAGIPMADEPAILAEAIQLVQNTVDVPLAIDSSIVAALEAGLAVYKGKPIVNSVTGEEERLEVVLPLVKNMVRLLLQFQMMKRAFLKIQTYVLMWPRKLLNAPLIMEFA